MVNITLTICYLIIMISTLVFTGIVITKFQKLKRVLEQIENLTLHYRKRIIDMSAELTQLRKDSNVEKRIEEKYIQNNYLRSTVSQKSFEIEDTERR